MRTGVSVSVSTADRRRLEAIVADRNTAQKHVWRARIILLTADGLGTMAIMEATGKSKTTVWRWQERYAEAGVDGVLADKTRPPGKPPIAEARVGEVLRLTRDPPPHEATHWTARAMAKAAGLAVATVQKIWKAHGLAPHRWRTFKLSNDPAFVEKLTDVVGLYVNPPAHAVVLSIDEKSQIQALDRTQPGLPMKKGRGVEHARAAALGALVERAGPEIRPVQVIATTSTQSRAPRPTARLSIPASIPSTPRANARGPTSRCLFARWRRTPCATPAPASRASRRIRSSPGRCTRPRTSP